MHRIQHSLDNIAVLGLPTLGRQRLEERLGLHPIEDPQVRYVCDHPAEIKSFPLDCLSNKLTNCWTDGHADLYCGFVMVYGAPAEFLAQQIAGAAETLGSVPEDIEIFAVAVLEFWRAYHLALLHQYRCGTGTALLVNGDRSIAMETLLNTMEQRFGVRMTLLASSQTNDGVMAATWRESYAHVVEALAPECLDIYTELESCADLMGRRPEFGYDAKELGNFRPLELLSLLVEQSRIRSLLDRHGIKFHSLAVQLAAQKERDKLLVEQAKFAADSLVKIEELTKERQALQRENELLSRQLHQVQEETNQHCLRLEKSERQLGVQQEREKQFSRVRDEQDKLYAESQAKVEVLIGEKRTLQDENELLLLQLQQVQEELEQYHQRNQKSEQQIAAQKEREKQLTQARDEQAKLSTDYQARVKALSEEKRTAQSENELLLLQLHHVQEELEQYHLRHQKDQQLADFKKQVDAPPTSLWQRFGTGLGALWGPGSKKKRLIKRQAEVLRESGAFDAQWYLARYPDVAKAGVDPIEHYLKFGASEGRDPSAKFYTLAYLELNPDVAEAQMNPLLHYVKFGKAEGRRTRRF